MPSLKPRMPLRWAAMLLVLAGAGAAAAADLYQEGQFRSLVSDVKARGPGDNLTVLVMETSSAASTADTDTKRQTEAGITGLWDVGPSRRAGEINGHIQNDFSGAARTQRAGKLLAQITVVVQSVAPNGDLQVAGDQVVEVNNEKQMIRLEGKVRPADIGADNSVVSNRIAEARIHYVGDGVLAAGQQPGWITRVLTWMGL